MTTIDHRSDGACASKNDRWGRYADEVLSPLFHGIALCRRPCRTIGLDIKHSAFSMPVPQAVADVPLEAIRVPQAVPTAIKR
ncbi:hypothetical protein [Erythrobacter sp.]|uniref:hypothetical protein n=1 Tax=Erythrobacter sp. TaxID=1042 RepID=UPI001AFDC3ED|nr:hypothetical protein [Erythrobacter sp.]MBO6526868.1 hypothetical protein [Erythrobacter sp.]MBO6528541.1 hypothetical protein [Erythrobacter sp.]